LIQRPSARAMPKPSAPMTDTRVQHAALPDGASVVDRDARGAGACRRRSRRARRSRCPRRCARRRRCSSPRR
jgi:hypothetical protein